MNDRQLEAFIAVADNLNFCKAAELLYTTQPVISYQVQTLEKELQAKLFERTSRKVILTRSGEAFYEKAKQMLRLWHEASKEAGAHYSGTRSVYVIGSSLYIRKERISPIATEFSAAFPEINLTFAGEDFGSQLEPLRCGLQNARFVFLFELDGVKDIESVPLYTTANYCIMHHDHPLASKSVLRISDFDGQVLYVPDGWEKSAFLKNNIGHIQQECPSALFVTGSTHSSGVTLAFCNSGIAFLPDACQEEHPSLVHKMIEGFECFEIGLAWHSDDETPETKHIVHLAQKAFADIDFPPDISGHPDS